MSGPAIVLVEAGEPQGGWFGEGDGRSVCVGAASPLATPLADGPILGPLQHPRYVLSTVFATYSGNHRKLFGNWNSSR
jgi:hypothetical protein